jgi:hypothetical protein
MAKEIRLSQNSVLIPESRAYRDEQTAKEMLKKFPRKEAQKKEELLKVTKKLISIKKKKHHKMVDKRTTPGMVNAESPPAHIHPEGKRWIKTLIKQNLAQRVIQDHKVGRGIRKK